MKLHIKSLMQIAAFLSTVALLPIQEAAAAPALVKIVEQPGRVPYQQMVEFNGGGLSNTSVSFNPVPAGKRLILEQVTLLIATNGEAPNMVIFGAPGSTNFSNTAIVKPEFFPGSSIFGSRLWSLNQEVRVYFEPGTTPNLKIFVPGSMTLVSNASLHGYLIDAN